LYLRTHLYSKKNRTFAYPRSHPPIHSTNPPPFKERGKGIGGKGKICSACPSWTVVRQKCPLRQTSKSKCQTYVYAGLEASDQY
jgi:hypothetical protein